jgi:hypothetical protein
VQALAETATHAANSRQDLSTAGADSPTFNRALQAGSYQIREFPQYVNAFRAVLSLLIVK